MLLGRSRESVISMGRLAQQSHFMSPGRHKILSNLKVYTQKQILCIIAYYFQFCFN
jgi:hypothetical protein